MRNTDNDSITQAMLDKSDRIEILSGEGEVGTREAYDGKRTVRAVKALLTKERCGGDRWAVLMLDGERSVAELDGSDEPLVWEGEAAEWRAALAAELVY